MATLPNIDFIEVYVTVADDAAGTALLKAVIGNPLSNDFPGLTCQGGAVEHDHPTAGPTPPEQEKQTMRKGKLVRAVDPPTLTPGKTRVRLLYAAAPLPVATVANATVASTSVSRKAAA